ncbi:hypothetical protein [uncultured Imperialibacter sp.]|uniref:hypothetical protein n=1 Tax=uncultured Imperialibacter sp. TaxID=1672639 RepID=UPI0030DD8315|tara:strand:+ start:1742 stop:2083 length:342 start_codon:yes stop_codon:yes gene_type:complete
MKFPPIIEMGFSPLLYLLLFYILYLGMKAFFVLRIRKEPYADNPARIVYLGAAASVIGIIACIQKYREAMEAIESAGDISPSLVAGSISEAFAYPTLGFFCLALSFLFRFVSK